MATNAKVLDGLRRIQVFPLLRDDYDGYAADNDGKFFLPGIQQLAKQSNTQTIKIPGDDIVYASIGINNDTTLTATFAELIPENMEKLGFGRYDTTSRVYFGTMQGLAREFAMTAVAERTDGSFLIFKYFRLIITDITDQGLSTKGNGQDYVKYTVTFTMTPRKCDGLPFQMYEVDAPAAGTAPNLAWADSIDDAPVSGG
jgi:hypothetical protein